MSRFARGDCLTKIFQPLMTPNDLESNSRLTFFKSHVKSFIFRYIKSSFRSVRNLTPFAPKCPRMTSGLFLKLQKIILTKLSLFNVNCEKNNHIVSFLRIKQMCYSEVSYFSSAVKFQTLLLSFLNSIKSKADSQIFNNFCSQGVSEIPKDGL